MTKSGEAYTKRVDGRGFKDMRPMSAKVGIIARADGSAMFQIGDTVAYAAVYGPRELHPKFMQNPSTGILRCNYAMMPFSGHGSRVRPGTSRRAKEISMITRDSLLPVLDLSKYANSVVDVFISLPQTDAGTRCAGICAASMALAHAGFEMKDMVAAVSVGVADEQVLADINAHEDCDIGASDIPVAMLAHSGKVSLLQLDGIVSPATLKNALDLAKELCKKIADVQRQALKDSFPSEVSR